jgi:hypothetical protein
VLDGILETCLREQELHNTRHIHGETPCPTRIPHSADACQPQVVIVANASARLCRCCDCAAELEARLVLSEEKRDADCKQVRPSFLA